jgi:hypothetical protein
MKIQMKIHWILPPLENLVEMVDSPAQFVTERSISALFAA